MPGAFRTRRHPRRFFESHSGQRYQGPRETAPHDVKETRDWTPLHYAALYGSDDAVQIILDRGGDPNSRTQSGATPLILAAYSLEKTRLMVEKGADVNAKANDGTTPLWVAAGAPGNERTVRYLLEKGADPTFFPTARTT